MKRRSSSSSAAAGGGGGGASQLRRRYASDEKRGASEYKKEWGRFMTGIHKKRTTTTSSSSSASASAQHSFGGPKLQHQQQITESSGVKPCMDLSAMAGSTFSYLFDAKKHKAKSDRVQSQRDADERRRIGLAQKRERLKQQELEKRRQQRQHQEQDEQAQTGEHHNSEDDTADNHHRRRGTDALQQFAVIPASLTKQSTSDTGKKRRQRNDADDGVDGGNNDNDDFGDDSLIAQPSAGWGSPQFNWQQSALAAAVTAAAAAKKKRAEDIVQLPDYLYSSKMEKVSEIAKDSGIELDGLNRKQRRQALQLTVSEAERKVKEKRKKTSVQDLMDQKLQWYQQGPYPLDEITEKLVNKKALKHVKVRPELKLNKYNYELIHPSWMAVRQRRRFEAQNCFGTGMHVKFSDSDNDDERQ